MHMLMNSSDTPYSTWGGPDYLSSMSLLINDDAKNARFSCCFTGCFPLSDPLVASVLLTLPTITMPIHANIVRLNKRELSDK